MPSVYRVGAELFLRAGDFTGPLRSSFDHLNKLKAEAGPTGAAIRGMAKDFAIAGAAAYGAVKMIDLYNKGVEKAKKGAEAGIDLKISMTTIGDDPADFEKRFKEMRRSAFEVSKLVSGTKADLERAYGQALKLGVPEATLRGGLGKAGALYADATQQDKVEAIRQILGFSAPFRAKPEDLGKYADLLVKGQMASRFTDAASIAHEMEFAAPALGTAGLTPESAMTWLATIGQIRTFGAGRALRSGFSGLLDAKPGKLASLGIDLKKIVDKDTGAFNLEALQAGLRNKLGTLPEFEQQKRLMKVFDQEAAVAFQSLLVGDVSTVRAAMESKPGVEAQRTMREESANYWEMVGRGTMDTAVTEAFEYGEKASKIFWEAFANKVASPVAETFTESKGAKAGAAIGTAGVALGLGATAIGFGSRGLSRLAQAAKLSGGYKNLFFPNIAGTAARVGAGKILEKTAGVTPVYVVNVDDFSRAGAFTGAGGGGLVDRYGRPIAPSGAPSGAPMPVSGGMPPVVAGGAGKWMKGLQYAGAIGAGWTIAEMAAPIAIAANEATDAAIGTGGGKGAMAAAMKLGLNPLKVWDDMTRITAEAGAYGWAAITGDTAGKKTFGRALKGEGEEYGAAFKDLFGPIIDLFQGDKQSKAAETNDQAAQKFAEGVRLFGEFVSKYGAAPGALPTGTRSPGSLHDRGK